MWLVVIFAAPTASALMRVWVRQQAVSLGYQLHQAEQRSEALRADLQKVEVARAAGRTPQRVSAMAKALGMGPPTGSQVVVVRPYAAPGRREPAPAVH